MGDPLYIYEADRYFKFKVNLTFLVLDYEKSRSSRIKYSVIRFFGFNVVLFHGLVQLGMIIYKEIIKATETRCEKESMVKEVFIQIYIVSPSLFGTVLRITNCKDDQRK